jgi:toxin-antitoxin system PIN domain toxin
VTYLLDVNALLALGYQAHTHHPRAGAWLSSRRKEKGLTLATCAITELGFVRVASGSATAHASDVTTAKLALARLKSNPLVHFEFLNDHLGADSLPAWVHKSNQTTDGHLAALAVAHGAKLATFDSGIPGAELIN